MKYVTFGCILLMYTIGMAHGTCVLESDFGFILNCNFKKASLFRVRNLGGVKAHFGLGFSVGDELGLAESLGNLEGNKRRSLSQRDSLSVNNIGVFPAAKLTPTPMIKQNRPQALTVRPQPPSIPGTSMTTRAPIFYKQHTPSAMTEAKSLPLGVPAFKPLQAPANNAALDNTINQTPTNSLQQVRQKLHQPVPTTMPLDAQQKQMLMQQLQQQQNLQQQLQQQHLLQKPQQQHRPQHLPQSTFSRKAAMYQYPAPNLALANMSFIQSQLAMQALHQPSAAALTANYAPKYAPVPISPAAGPFKLAVPAFQAMPSSVSRISTGQIVHLDVNGKTEAINQNTIYASHVKREDNKHSFNKHHDVSSQLPTKIDHPLPQVDLKGHTVEELAAVANVSVDAIKKAIELRQKQLIAAQEVQIKRQMEEEANQLRHRQESEIANQLAMYQYQQQQYMATSTPSSTVKSTTVSATTRQTTTRRPATTPRPIMAGGQKVMNAPKEYYPVGYEKNFDDNFATKVDLPPTSFHCGDQKHFPGLYSDTDLGCMVFHVCALTDDGLIMKSFLCPESTLFDQTILKCNWWFYVDCKTSKGLYDSNLPVSKSYQLMKALTFFQNFKKGAKDTDDFDIEALKNSVLAGSGADSKSSSAKSTTSTTTTTTSTTDSPAVA